MPDPYRREGLGICVCTQPQLGATYEDQLRVARWTEEAGLDGFFRSDHYVAPAGDGLPGPTDSWVTLAGLARETRRIRLGTLVTAATFRLPGPLAVQVAQVDAMSGGRVELGIGAGWSAQEHDAYGIPFPPPAERFDRLEEQLEILTGLWRTPVDETYHHAGTHYRLSGCPALPKPVQSTGVPLILGGTGARRTPALAARFATEFNVANQPADETARCFTRVQAACTTVGRDPSSLRLSVAFPILCGRTDLELTRRAAALGQTLERARAMGVTGTPAECADAIGPYLGVGADRIYLQVLDLADLDHLDLIGDELVPQLRVSASQRLHLACSATTEKEKKCLSET